MKKYFTIPSVCPICGKKTSIKKDNDSEFLVCLNPECSGKVINKLDHFCGKKGLDIKGLSKATLSKLMDWGWLNNYEDLFNLKDHASEWKKKSGFGEKSVNNILESIEKSRNCKLSNFIAALGIPLIGSTVSKELIKHFPTWESFMDAINSNFKFYELTGFGPEMSESLLNFNYQEANQLYCNYILSNTTQQDQEEYMSKKLEGFSIVITGKLALFKNREELKSFIEKHGGKVVSSISSKTTCLINNDINSLSAKNIEAKKNGISILSEEQFIKAFNL